ncbi:unnamed protein product [Onchocerca flexuosa]|uniref:Uncharacterized protein n=1 Tax=Onchocerca flexuosa TaxID=387005 RepID=A0A183HGL1_9BILA|nr:unnamed protein product [Onchocerca flexuosa]
MIDEAMLITILAHQTFSLAAITTFALIAIIQCTKKKDSTGAVPPGQPPPAPAPLPPMDEQKTQSLMDEGEGEKKKVEEKKEVGHFNSKSSISCSQLKSLDENLIQIYSF